MGSVHYVLDGSLSGAIGAGFEKHLLHMTRSFRGDEEVKR